MHSPDRDTPDYVRYSLDQLRTARRTIDSERFPERTSLLELLIADREHRESLAAAAPVAVVTPGRQADASEKLHALLQGFRRRNLSLTLTPALRRSLAILSIGGGFLGMISALMAGLSAGGITFLFTLPACAIYALGILSGVMLLEGHAQAVIRNQAYWALQVPVLFSPLLSYQVGGGLVLNLGLNVSFLDLWYGYQIGSTFALNILTPQPTLLGVNAVAAIFTLLLMHVDEPATPASQSASLAPVAADTP